MDTMYSIVVYYRTEMYYLILLCAVRSLMPFLNFIGISYIPFLLLTRELIRNQNRVETDSNYNSAAMIH